jgi:raffinose/stachyose/melibiose transport system substrate-binding protein
MNHPARPANSKPNVRRKEETMSDDANADKRVEAGPRGEETRQPEATMTRRSVLKSAAMAGGGLALLGTPGSAAARPFITRAKVTIDYWTWHHISQVPTEKGRDRIKAAFEQANPNITLNVKLFPFPDYLTALKTAVPNGSSGDVLGLQNGALLRQYRPYLQTLNTLAEKGMGKNWQKAYLSKAISLPQRENNWPHKSDEYWWMPAEVAILGAQWYWQDIFQKVGVSVPKDYGELKEISDKLRSAGYIPTAWGAKDQWPNTDYLIVYASQFRPGVVEAAELGERKFTDRAIVAGLTFMAQTVKDNLYNTGPFGTTAYPEAYQSMFAARKAAMINTGAHNISLAGTPGAQENWRAFLFPHIPGAPQSNWLGKLPSGVPTPTGPSPSRLIFDVGYLVSMRKGLDKAKQDAAWRFIQFYVGPKGQRINSFWTQPSLKAVHISGFTNKGFVNMLNWHFAVAEFGERREFLFPETREALQTAIENVIVNNADPRTELAKVDVAAKKARLKAGGKK